MSDAGNFLKFEGIYIRKLIFFYSDSFFFYKKLLYENYSYLLFFLTSKFCLEIKFHSIYHKHVIQYGEGCIFFRETFLDSKIDCIHYFDYSIGNILYFITDMDAL